MCRKFIMVRQLQQPGSVEDCPAWCPIKPKGLMSVVATSNIDLDDKQEHDRIVEKLSLTVPAVPLAIRPKPIWGKFLGQRVRLQLRDGTLVSGTLRYQLWEYLRIENVVEEGKNYRLTANWVMVDVNSVARFYPGDANIEKLAGA